MNWLVNDQLGALGERTYWHDMLDLGFVDMTGGYTPFDKLADKIEATGRLCPPKLILRNGTYFRPINLPVHTISFVQDVPTHWPLQKMQQDVMKSSDVVVFNSEYTKTLCHDEYTECAVIPIGVDFELFKPQPTDVQLPADTILFVGASTRVKGWNLLCQLINETKYHFAVVTKDNARIEHPRVTNFGRVSQQRLVSIMNACAALVCTSETETQHLAGIEAAACDLPVIAPCVGVYYDQSAASEAVAMTAFGGVVRRDVTHYQECIANVIAKRDKFSPRAWALASGFDKATSMNRWKELIG